MPATFSVFVRIENLLFDLSFSFDFLNVSVLDFLAHLISFSQCFPPLRNSVLLLCSHFELGQTDQRPYPEGAHPPYPQSLLNLDQLVSC